jgi:hypothetical protein
VKCQLGFHWLQRQLGLEYSTCSVSRDSREAESARILVRAVSAGIKPGQSEFLDSCICDIILDLSISVSWVISMCIMQCPLWYTNLESQLILFATVLNSRINSWESWFIFNLQKKEQ